jgi:K+-transporting ATPase ATPase B chain
MKERAHPDRSIRSLFDPAIILPAVGHSFRKLDPRLMIRNPVMFVVEVVSVLTINQFIDWSTYSLTSLFVSDSLTT